jgi:LPS-assembly protein
MEASASINNFFDVISSPIEKTFSQFNIKPYKISIEQGKLINEKKLNKIDTGLSKDQVLYLLGKPSTTNPFVSDQWNYLYFNNSNQKEIKKLVIYFKNEKVYKILIQNEIYKKLGMNITEGLSLNKGPINIQTVKSDEDIKPIILTLENNTALDSAIDVCNVNDFETFADVRTLIDSDETTLEIRADNQSQIGNEFKAEGNAEAERQKDFLKADSIIYDTVNKNLSASGNVKYFEQDISVYSNSANYLSSKNEINFSKAKYHLSDKTGSGNADDIFIKNNKDIVLKNGTFTSCSIMNPDWELTSTTTTLYNDIDRGHSYNMLLKYKNVPVFYTPFISFPLSDERQSGILTPSFGSAGDSGTYLSVPYYFNLAKNYDLTVEVKSLSDRGMLIDNEFRYLGLKGSSLLNFTHLESDDEFGDDRYLYSLKDDRSLINTLNSAGESTNGMTMYSSISYSRVSDLDYFDDFGNSLSTASQSSVKRDMRVFGAKYNHKGRLNYEISSLTYQPSQLGVSEQYETSPSVLLNYSSMGTKDKYNYNIKTRFDEFKHKDSSKAEGSRYVFYPSIQMPLIREGWELHPKLGIRYIDYSLNDSSVSSKSKTTPIASLRGKLYFDKQIGNRLYTMEPEAYLLYVPVGNQDDNPIFDSGIKEFKYSLFSENQFYGEDRLNDAKQLALAITHRIVDEDSGDELFTGTIGQILYFDDRDVHLTSNTKKHSDSSNIIGLVSAQISEKSFLSIGSVFNPHSGHGMRNAFRYRYDNSTGLRNKIFNADYRFVRGDEEEIDLSGVYSFNRNFSAVGKFNYSFSNNRSNAEDLIDTMFGIEMNSCCYAIKIVARDYWTGTKKDNVLYFEFLPKGLTSSNNSTASLLREGIPGYEDKTRYE